MLIQPNQITRALLVVAVLMLGNAWTTTAQDDGNDDEFSAEQQSLIALVEAANADRRGWESYKELSIETFSYTEDVQINADTRFVISQTVDSTITSVYERNPIINLDYNADHLLTVQVRTDNEFGPDRQTSDIYGLTVNTRYFDERLYVRGLYTGPPNEALVDTLSEWQDITDDPEQFPLLQTANLYRFLPEAPPEAGLNPLLGADLVRAMRVLPLRDVLLDIEQMADQQVILNGAGAEVTTRQVRLRLEPLPVLAAAFAGDPERAALVAAFSNANAEIELLLWIDTNNFRHVLEQYRITLAGSPAPEIYGYGENEIEPDGGVTVNYTLQRDVLYADINIPLTVEQPLLNPQ
jgi:hypothetical protein